MHDARVFAKSDLSITAREKENGCLFPKEVRVSLRLYDYLLAIHTIQSELKWGPGLFLKDCKYISKNHFYATPSSLFLGSLKARRHVRKDHKVPFCSVDRVT